MSSEVHVYMNSEMSVTQHCCFQSQGAAEAHLERNGASFGSIFDGQTF